jgi:Flp pilus assembly protein TadG
VNRAARAAARRVRQRGAVSIMFALMLTVLVGFIALVVDIGHFWEVQEELQNAADSAALAGAHDLNGTATNFPLAILSAEQFALRHDANGSPVNVPAADVVLGTWNFNTRTFTPTLIPAPQVNAVQVTTRRSAAAGDPVRTFFAPLVGVTQQDVTTVAIAVSGSPNATCGFPLAIPDCSIYDAAGNLSCNTVLQFASTPQNNVAFTLMSSVHPNTPAIECAMATALGYPTCPKSCNCASKCVSTATNNGQIDISNGNNFSDPMISYVQWALANAPPGGLFIQVPVISTGLTSNCSRYILTGNQSIAGYATLQITGATGAPNKTILSTIDCSKSNAVPPGQQGFFGYKATQIYLTK